MHTFPKHENKLLEFVSKWLVDTSGSFVEKSTKVAFNICFWLTCVSLLSLSPTMKISSGSQPPKIRIKSLPLIIPDLWERLFQQSLPKSRRHFISTDSRKKSLASHNDNELDIGNNFTTGKRKSLGNKSSTLSKQHSPPTSKTKKFSLVLFCLLNCSWKINQNISKFC